jgi:adenylate cyclase
MPGVPEFEAAGLLAGLDDDARGERVELLNALTLDGFSIEELQDAGRVGRLALLPVDRLLAGDEATYTSADLAEQTGMPLDVLERLWRALGMAHTEPTDVAFGQPDLDAARTVAQFHAAGLGEEPLALIGQVLGSGMSRLAETIREIVGDALLEAGDSERTLGLRYAQATEQLTPLLTPLLGYVLSVHLREQIKTDIVSETELRTGLVENARHITVCFADLVGFTRMGERVPAGELSAAGRHLTELAVEVARPPVRLVKTIGDAAMLVSTEPEPLVRAALELVAQTERRAEGMPPLRVGIASGEAIAQSGDWLGAPVNLASRVTDVARPASVLATKPVRDALGEAFAWSDAGRRRFKGVRDEVRLFRVRPAQPPA